MYTKLSVLKTKKDYEKVLANIIIKEDMTKTKEKFFKITLNDGDKDVIMCIFKKDKTTFEMIEKLNTNSVVEVEMKFMGTNSGGFDEYSIKSMKEVKKISTMDCVDIEKLKKRLKIILSKEITDKSLKELAYKIFEDKTLQEKIFNSPLSEMNGYSFKGGLLAHIVRLSELIIKVSECYNSWDYNNDNINIKINKDLLIVSAILSDIGATTAYEIKDNVIVKTLEGRINEESYYTCKILFGLLEKSDLEYEKKILLENVVTSAKGYNGSINSMKTKESAVMYNLKKLDVFLSNFEYMTRVSIGDFGKINTQEYQKDYFLLDFNEF